MYKILITTRYYGHGTGASVHTVIAEFRAEADADRAINAVKSSHNSGSGITQTAIRLY